jgi:ParB-like chromosome segregation protein Spo0J
MEVISRKISELYNDPNNARKHDEKNLKAIKGSLKKFNQQLPIIIDVKDIVIAGNCRLEAARQLGWTHIDCVVTSLDKFDATAYSIADNQIGTMGTWNEMILGSTLQALREDGFDLGEIGFDTSALDDVEEETGEDEKEPVEKPLTLLISCKDEDEQQMLFLELRDRGFKVKA